MVFRNGKSEERAELVPCIVLLYDVHDQQLAARHAPKHVLVVVDEALRIEMVVPISCAVGSVTVEEQVLALCTHAELTTRARDPRHEMTRRHDEAGVRVDTEKLVKEESSG